MQWELLSPPYSLQVSFKLAAACRTVLMSGTFFETLVIKILNKDDTFYRFLSFSAFSASLRNQAVPACFQTETVWLRKSPLCKCYNPSNSLTTTIFLLIVHTEYSRKDQP